MAKAKAKKERTEDSVTVSWKGNSREYSAAVHGDAYEALAEEFAKKVGGIVE